MSNSVHMRVSDVAEDRMGIEFSLYTVSEPGFE
jgi:hypothetical protein